MSKERKFHELIEQQNQEEKNRVWQKICKKDSESEKQDKNSVILKTHAFYWKKWGAVAASSLAIVILGVFSVVKFFPLGEDTPDNSGRYFTNQSYEMLDTSINIKSYAQQIGKDLLYFDWYTETDYCKNQEWKLNDTGEIICYSEEMVDVNTGCITYLFVLETDIKLDAFSSDEMTEQATNINAVKIQWQFDNDRAWANFEYEDYRYYLRVFESIDENYILDLVKELLS